MVKSGPDVYLFSGLTATRVTQADFQAAASKM